MTASGKYEVIDDLPGGCALLAAEAVVYAVEVSESPIVASIVHLAHVLFEGIVGPAICAEVVALHTALVQVVMEPTRHEERLPRADVPRRVACGWRTKATPITSITAAVAATSGRSEKDAVSTDRAVIAMQQQQQPRPTSTMVHGSHVFPPSFAGIESLHGRQAHHPIDAACKCSRCYHRHTLLLLLLKERISTHLPPAMYTLPKGLSTAAMPLRDLCMGGRATHRSKLRSSISAEHM